MDAADLADAFGFQTNNYAVMEPYRSPVIVVNNYIGQGQYKSRTRRLFFNLSLKSIHMPIGTKGKKSKHRQVLKILPINRE